MLINRAPKRHNLPPILFALFVAIASAAATFGQAERGSPDGSARSRRVVASGRLLGTRELQQVSVWHTSGAHLAIQTAGPRPRVIWQTDGNSSSANIDSVRIADLDADGIPEILSLWWSGPIDHAVLRVFHWDRDRQSFIELESASEIDNVRSYRVVSLRRPASRIVVEMRAENGPRLTSREYELRGSKLFRVGGGPVVTTKGDSGIEGQALISPARPGPIRSGQPSSAPYKTTIVVWNEGTDREVTRVETGADGRFRIALPPGTYNVGPPRQTGRFLPRGSEETVTVRPGTFVQVTINFDSGMR